MGTIISAPIVICQRAADEEAIQKRETDKTAYTKLWNEFGKALKMGVVEDTANRNRLAKLLRVCCLACCCWHCALKRLAHASSQLSTPGTLLCRCRYQLLEKTCHCCSLQVNTSKSPVNLTSLDDYIARMKPDQKDILYIAGAHCTTAQPDASNQKCRQMQLLTCSAATCVVQHWLQMPLTVIIRDSRHECTPDV